MLSVIRAANVREFPIVHYAAELFDGFYLCSVGFAQSESALITESEWTVDRDRARLIAFASLYRLFDRERGL
jgi:hypothetical protein